MSSTPNSSALDGARCRSVMYRITFGSTGTGVERAPLGMAARFRTGGIGGAMVSIRA